ncbi:hypothetical protein [Phaeobacter inhibens]|uniref:hypothetical protein n=1 Tax=Phaeobacter inhibens TaxID=221822 RepID=UPI0021A7AEDD|nr:hypothetical protein [Phaeobacter inhibens]
MKTKRVFDGQRGVITSIFVASIFVNLLVLTAPLYMLQLFARVMASGSMPTLIALTTGAAIALVFFFLFDVIRQRLVARLGSRLEARLSPVVLQGMISGNLPAPLRTAEPIATFRICAALSPARCSSRCWMRPGRCCSSR